MRYFTFFQTDTKSFYWVFFYYWWTTFQNFISDSIMASTFFLNSFINLWNSFTSVFVKNIVFSNVGVKNLHSDLGRASDSFDPIVAKYLFSVSIFCDRTLFWVFAKCAFRVLYIAFVVEFLANFWLLYDLFACDIKDATRDYVGVFKSLCFCISDR